MKKMERNCKDCEKFQKHSYWSHSDSNKIIFCKKMEGLYMHSMTLPNEFSKNFEGPIGEIAHLKLKSQTGTETWYHVRAKRSEEKLVFKNGWKDFITSNKIQEDYLLLFRYCGVSSFEVTVYDESGCNRTSPVLDQNEEETSEDESVQIVELPTKVKEEISVSSDKSGSSFKGLKRVLEEEEVHETEKIVTKRKRGRPSKNKDIGSTSSRAPIHVKKEPGTKTTEPDNDCQLSFMVPKDVKLTKRQEKIANEMSRAAQIGNPKFVHVMCACNFSPLNYLEIPDNFAPQILKRADRTIVLQRPDKKKWDCWYYYVAKLDMRAIGGNWKKFVLDNCLKEGHLCLFELMKDECMSKLTMTVHF
ncbi:hypothetical protein LUZ60_005025 [Juncus effusus]|nr:hypothetical protein LUZ60_005025 [Juncus effusus]